MSAVISVHQVGKVGSSSVVEALRELLPGQHVHQTHVLSERRLLDALRRWLGRSQQFPGFRFYDHLRSSIEISKALAQGLSRQDWYLMSLVREPIARHVSALFQNLRLVWVHKLPPRERELCILLLRGKSVPEAGAIRDVAAALVAYFQSNYPREFVDRWFDEEMKGVFGIDVFDSPFPKDRGWQILQKGTVRLLVMRLEDLRGSFDPGVREWLRGSPWQKTLDVPGPLELKRANDSEDKNYILIYREFFKMLTLDPALVEREYRTRTARHFYSDDELSRFAEKWKKPATSMSPA